MLCTNLFYLLVVSSMIVHYDLIVHVVCVAWLARVPCPIHDIYWLARVPHLVQVIKTIGFDTTPGTGLMWLLCMFIGSLNEPSLIVIT